MKLTSFLLSLSVMLLVMACKKNTLTLSTPTGSNTAITQGLSGESSEAFKAKLASLPPMPASDRAPVSYTGTLCGYNVDATHATANSLGDPLYWDYYEFSGQAGDQITVLVQRTSPGMDPYAEIRMGLLDDSDNWYGLGLVAAGDDNVEDPFGSCNNDPFLTITLPETGTYTLGVADFVSCGSPLKYQIVTTGIHCDSDGDGVYEVEDNCPNTANPGQENCDGDTFGDACDAHPCSNGDAAVRIDGTDTLIPNIQVGGGSNMMDLLLDCAAGATNHGNYVSCVTQLANDWKSAGLITQEQKNTMLHLATKANIP